MNYPDIKTYYRDKRQHFINSSIHSTHFLGRSAMDVRWRMNTPAASKELSNRKIEVLKNESATLLKTAEPKS